MTSSSSFVPEFRRRIQGFARSLRDDKWALLLIPAVSVYVVVWSYITTLKFYALHATVFDLGLEMEQLWKFVHPVGFTPTIYVLAALDQPFQFLLSPLSLPLSYPLLLVVQSLGLGSGAFAVYGIARHLLKRQVDAYLLSLAYLLYFPLGGVNWFDFHAQAFFIPLFLWGFLCYLTRRFRLAFVLFMLAGGTTYSYVVLVVLFSGLTLLELFVRRTWFKQNPVASEWRFSAFLLAASVAFFVYQFAIYSYFLGVSFTQNADIVAGSVPLLNRVGVLVFLLLPTVFLTVLAPKWLAMLAPFAYIELHSAARPFNFPAIFQIQYTALAIPFVVIGTVYGMRTVHGLLDRLPVPSDDPSRPRRRVYRFLRRPHRAGGLALTVLVLAIGFATVFQPYGPFNQCCADKFGIAAETDVNWTYFDQYSHLVGLIPGQTPYVLFQNSMPTVLPRPLLYEGAPLVTGLEQWVNATTSDSANNQFPLEIVQGRLVYTPLDYAISDPSNFWYTAGGNVSMFAFFSAMYQSGFYGLEGEASGMTVLARGYSGPLEYYAPFSGTLPSTDLYVGATGALSSGPALSRSNLTGEAVWHSGHFPLAPGTFRIGFSLMTSTTAPTDSLSLVIVGNDTGTILSNTSLTGSEFPHPEVWTTVSLTVRLVTAYDELHFAAWDAHWNGSIAIRSISVTEIAPPSTAFAGGDVLLPSESG